MDPFEKFTIQEYMWRALRMDEGRSSGAPKRPSRAIAMWIYAYGERVGVPEFSEDLDTDLLDADVGGRVDRATWSSMSETLQKCDRTPERKLSGTEQRLNWLSETLGLSAPEADILKVCVRVACNKIVWRLAEAISDEGTGSKELNATSLSALSGLQPSLVKAMLEAREPLISLGLLIDTGNTYTPSDLVIRVTRAKSSDPAKLRQMIFGKARPPTLAWSDFEHLGGLSRIAEKMLKAALAKNQKGVNLLFYGDPGTGKTEFASSLAARIGADALFIGEEDADGDEPCRQSRIAKFNLVQALTEKSKASILVVDEADDIFVGVDSHKRSSRAGSKVFMNRLVDTTRTPTIWITNHPDRIGDAIIRRMMMAIPFPKTGKRVRTKIVEQIAHRRRVKLSQDEIEQMARIDAAPAVIDNALRVMQMTKEPVSSAVAAAGSINELLAGGKAPPEPVSAFKFDPAMSAADVDLAKLADDVVASGKLAVSLCLYGLPGTGKSAFARYLADRLNVEVLHKRASDLLSKWVGESEENIADAFREARDKKALLILDEADSLLRDRGTARQSWEVTQVNEMLTWMESHPFPFVCTTNLMDSLDPASLRRFVFKVQFKEMTADQAREAFRRSFSLEAPTSLDRLALLTPGDFSVVARKAAITGVTDPESLVALLAGEVGVKPEAKRPGRIGF